MKQNYLVYGISTDYFLDGTTRGWLNDIKVCDDKGLIKAF
jgi:hypothetical protein